MQIKRFRGQTIAAVLAEVKAGLGPDAVLISSRNLPPGKASPGEKVEVTVAVEGKLEPGLAEVNPPSGRVAINQMQDDIAHIRALLSVSLAKETIPWMVRTNSQLRVFFEKLIAAGVDEALALELLQALMNGLETEGAEPDDDTVRRELSRVLRQAVSVTAPPLDRPIRWALIGPTGGGKTTTLAKLAAVFSKHQGRRVGLITVDNYRLGAAEQLAAYARLLDLELMVAYNRDELRQALKALSDREVVLIDTAGRNHRDPANMADLARLVRDVPGLDRFLVMPSPVGQRQMSAMVKSYLEIGLSGLIFTKLDETDHYGGIINQVLRYHLPVAYLTTGQRVPQDIEPASHEKLLKLVLNHPEVGGGAWPRQEVA